MTKQPEGLALVEAHLAKDLEDRRAGGARCPLCDGDYYCRKECPDCNGSGKSPAITQAEEALKACRDAMERERRVRDWADKWWSPITEDDTPFRQHFLRPLFAILNAPPVEEKRHGQK